MSLGPSTGAGLWWSYWSVLGESNGGAVLGAEVCVLPVGWSMGQSGGLRCPLLAAGAGLASPLGAAEPLWGSGRAAFGARYSPLLFANPLQAGHPPAQRKQRGKNTFVKSPAGQGAEPAPGETRHTPRLQTLRALLCVRSHVPGSRCPPLPSVMVLNTRTRKKKKKIHLKIDFPGWKITGANLGNFIKRRRRGKKSARRLGGRERVSSFRHLKKKKKSLI